MSLGKSEAKTSSPDKARNFFDDRHFSSDEENLETPLEPVINLLSFGWMEDGRLGYPDILNENMQLCPKPVGGIRRPKDIHGRFFVAKTASAGSRHTIVLMINYLPEKGRFGRKSKKLMFFGLNQGGLCEDAGIECPEDVAWDEEEIPLDVVGGYGTCFVISKSGNLFSFGIGRYGVLGHGNDETWQIPRQVMSLERVRVKKVACGKSHTACITYNGKAYTWGKNRFGQLGRDTFSEMEAHAIPIPSFTNNDHIVDISCGSNHCVAIVKTKRKDNSINTILFAWGDYRYMQLGEAEDRFCARPQDLRKFAKYCDENDLSPRTVICGGTHNLVVINPTGQVQYHTLVHMWLIYVYVCCAIDRVLGRWSVWSAGNGLAVGRQGIPSDTKLERGYQCSCWLTTLRRCHRRTGKCRRTVDMGRQQLWPIGAGRYPREADSCSGDRCLERHTSFSHRWR